MILLCAALLLAAGYTVYKNISDLDEVKKGIAIIRKGGAGYAIPECTGAAKEIAEGVNALGEGLEAAVESSVKSERMKTELITNVSHDLKTPLTSVINYAELLSQMRLSPEEANDYALIIKRKSERLKALTTDLFDISKAQSGNEELDLERLDLKLLITQALGELNREIDGSGLDFRVSLPEEEALITADGRKLSRVFENLISNAVKYSMKGTRVYVTLEKKDGVFVTELKNIASYPMNFSPDEITERFVRGDKSRTGEGSGLGLAIAKSYTELMGGSFEIAADGDLFKAKISFKALARKTEHEA